MTQTIKVGLLIELQSRTVLAHQLSGIKWKFYSNHLRGQILYGVPLTHSPFWCACSHPVKQEVDQQLWWIPQTVQFSQHDSLSVCACVCLDTNRVLSAHTASLSHFRLLCHVITGHEKTRLRTNTHTRYEVISKRACALTEPLSLLNKLVLIRAQTVYCRSEVWADGWAVMCHTPSRSSRLFNADSVKKEKNRL